MAIHSSILAWRIPWTEEPGRLQSIGQQRVRHDLDTGQHSQSVGSLPSANYVINRVLGLGVPTLNK